jgi:hypothetical protein
MVFTNHINDNPSLPPIEHATLEAIYFYNHPPNTQKCNSGFLYYSYINQVTTDKTHHDSPHKTQIQQISECTHKKEQLLNISPKAQKIGDQPKTRQTPSAIEATEWSDGRQ